MPDPINSPTPAQRRQIHVFMLAIASVVLTYPYGWEIGFATFFISLVLSARPYKE